MANTPDCDPPDGVWKVLHEIANEIRAALSTLPDHLVAVEDRLSQKIRRLGVVVALLSLLLIVVIGGFGILQVGNRVILDTINCVVSDPACPKTARSREATGNIEDNLKCDARRTFAGLPPAPDPLRPCRDQTPPEVYTSPLCSLPADKNPCKLPGG